MPDSAKAEVVLEVGTVDVGPRAQPVGRKQTLWWFVRKRPLGAAGGVLVVAMVMSAAEYAQKAPWLVLLPGTVIRLAVFGTNLLGDALRDVPDPRLRQA
jgi:hypothetical protein